MNKTSICVVILLICLSLCSSLTIEDFEGVEYYESSSNGFWPMPGANIQNNGYTDMGRMDFSANAAPRRSLTNDEGETRSPPIMDRNGFVYTLQKTNDTKDMYICTIECYDPLHNDFHLWSYQLQGYQGPCYNALLAFNTGESVIALVDAYLYLIQLNQNQSEVPPPVAPHLMNYNSSILVPLTDTYFLIDDSATRDLHVVYYFMESNCTNSSINNNNTHGNCSGDVVFIDTPTGYKVDSSHSPAAHNIKGIAPVASGLEDAPSMYVFVAEDNYIAGYNIETNREQWRTYAEAGSTFMSNVVVANDIGAVFAILVTNQPDSEIVLLGYTVNGTLHYTEKLYAPGGEEKNAGRLSVDLANKKVVAMIEEAPSNNTIVYVFDYHNLTLMSRNLEEANFQGPMSIDYLGHYYTITSQYSGYLTLNSGDLSQVDRVLDTTGGSINGVARNYAALGNNTLVVTGSRGTVGFAPVEEHHSSGGGSNHRTLIILLCVFGGLVLIVFLLALAGLIYHYYNRNKRSGYEQI